MRRTIDGDPSAALDRLQKMARERGATILTPHNRAARALGLPTRTLEEVATQLLAQHGRRVISPVEQQLLLNRILKVEQRESRVLDPEGIAARLHHGVETLLRNAENPEQTLQGEIEPQLVTLADVTANYRAELAKERLIDPAELLWQAARLVDQRICALFWGYFVPRKDELAFLDALAGDGSHFILPLGPESTLAGNRASAAWLAAQGWEGWEGWEGETPDEPKPTIKPLGWQIAQQFWRGEQKKEEAILTELWSEPSVEDEVRRVLGEVKRLLIEGLSAEEIVLATTQEALYGPKLLGVAWEFGISLQIPRPQPLRESPFGAWIRLAWKAIRERLPFEATFGTLAHRAGPGLSDEWLHQLLETSPHGVQAWRAEEVLPPTPASIPGNGENSLGRTWLTALDWPPQATRAVYRAHLEALLTLRQSSSRSALSGLSCGQERGEREFRQQLAAIELEDSGVAIPLGQQIDQWLELISLLTLSAEPVGAGGAVEVHRPEALLGASYRHVFLLGMVEGAWPEALPQAPLLDFHVRKRLAEKGIELGSAVEQVRRQALTFSCLLGTATERIILSLPRQRDREVTIRSPYLHQLCLREQRPSESEGESSAIGRVIASPEEARRLFTESAPKWDADPLLPAIRHAIKVERRRLSALPPDAYDGVSGIPLTHLVNHVWSASQLISLGKCAFQWFVRTGLGVREPVEPVDTLSARLFGILSHKVLELSLSGLPVGVDPRAYALERLEASFLEAEREVNLPRLPAWPARRQEILDRLREAVLAADFLEAGAEIVGLEVAFEGDFHGLPVRGIIDRVDRLPHSPADGREHLLFVDYKTAKTPPAGIQNEAGKAAIDLQLPLYQIVAGRTLYPGREVEGTYYSLLARKRIKNPAPAPEGWLPAFAGEVRTRVQEGRFPVAPDIERKACDYCDLSAVCRVGPRIARKEWARGKETEE
jgi:RecB family exonuclease